MGGVVMRKLQYYKIYELLNTLQEAVDILSDMNWVVGM